MQNTFLSEFGLPLNPNGRGEIWSPCPKLPHQFEISSFGRLFSKRTNRIVRLNSINGYPGHITKIGGRRGFNVVLKVHIETATAFVWNPNREEFNIVNHLDGDKWNPVWWNLEWTDHQSNSKHAFESGLIGKIDPWKFAEKTNLTDNQIKELIELSATKSERFLSRYFEINRTTVRLFLERYEENFKFQ